MAHSESQAVKQGQTAAEQKATIMQKIKDELENGGKCLRCGGFNLAVWYSQPLLHLFNSFRANVQG